MLGYGFVRVKPESQLFAGGNQPARRTLGLSSIAVKGNVIPVQTSELFATPFCALVEIARADTEPRYNVLLAAPLSGHFPVLLRDLIIGLLPFCRVYLTDWINVRHVPAEDGSFGLDTNISHLLQAINALPAGLNVIALCQAGVPALAASARLAAGNDPKTPDSLILIGAPIDPLINPTGIAMLLRSRPPGSLEANLIKPVPKPFAGAGRSVYPAPLHLISLWLYLTRRVSEGGELCSKVLFDDGVDAYRFPFLDLFTSIMDLDSRFLLENTRAVFQETWFRNGIFRFDCARTDPAAIERTALLTIEGELDDIAAPGQTSAAHALCRSLPARLHRRLVVPGSGHFSLFHGNACRRYVVPAIRAFLGR